VEPCAALAVGDQIKLDDLSEAVSGLADSMQHAADFVETRKAEMMTALSRGTAVQLEVIKPMLIAPGTSAWSVSRK